MSGTPGGLLIALAALAIAGTAGAHGISAPDTVHTDATGAFAYDITVLREPAADFSWAERYGSQEVELGHTIYDGRCSGIPEAGPFIFPIAARLKDTATAGTVTYVHALCDGWVGSVVTQVVRRAVPAVKGTWAAVKALYE